MLFECFTCIERNADTERVVRMEDAVVCGVRVVTDVIHLGGRWEV